MDKKQEYADICERVKVERTFSLAKLKFVMGLIRTYLQEISRIVIALSMLALNLSKVFSCAFFDYIVVFLHMAFFADCSENTAFV